jgi:hypothetical protein
MMNALNAKERSVAEFKEIGYVASMSVSCHTLIFLAMECKQTTSELRVSETLRTGYGVDGISCHLKLCAGFTKCFRWSEVYLYKGNYLLFMSDLHVNSLKGLLSLKVCIWHALTFAVRGEMSPASIRFLDNNTFGATPHPGVQMSATS